jgi:hypothetical protein
MIEQPTVEPIAVHNAWTIYGVNSDGTEVEQPIAQWGRPQDWGHPRWTYHRYQFIWESAPNGRHYVNHCHCWTDLQRDPGTYAELFAPFIAQILMPGAPIQLCGRSYLAEEDFWNKEWGKQPPFYPDDDDEIELDGMPETPAAF